MKNITGLTLKELEEVLTAEGQEPFRAKQIFSWVYKKGVLDFDRMSDLSMDLRSILKENFILSGLKIAQKLQSSDGTEKFLFELEDKNLIEAVSIPAASRVTGCISSQAGCKYACGFCASGKAGFKRDLTSAEIIEQVLHLKYNSAAKDLTHVVFMGTGEPLDNYDNVLKAVRLINSPDGFNIGARRITISTCGLVPAIERLSKEGLQVELSVSLHAADDKTRDTLVPVNKIYPIKTLIAACKDYISLTDRQVTFEYILINGINSALQNARDLSIMLKSMHLCKVNLIPANPVEELSIAPPQEAQILAFRDYLIDQGITATLRKPRGVDIQGACGQLRLKNGDK